jgi:hypothetical protein
MAGASTTSDFEGYRVGDITYCVDPRAQAFFPVRVVKVGRGFLEVELTDDELACAVAHDFGTQQENRRFVRPRLPAVARFGGCDERLVNAERVSGRELRLLPVHYNTYTNDRIRERNAADPARWPLPSGTLYERWFKDADGGGRRTDGSSS